MKIHTHTSVFDGRPMAEAWAYDAEGTLLKVIRCDYYGSKATALEQAECGLKELLSTREGAKSESLNADTLRPLPNT